jgi:hypothetical protein
MLMPKNFGKEEMIEVQCPGMAIVEKKLKKLAGKN